MNVKEAFGVARKELTSLLEEDGITDIRLEEAKIKSGTEIGGISGMDYWSFTFSYLPKETDPLISTIKQRIYKTLILDEEGRFISLQIRELAQV
jgi:hypothetical protein